MMSDNNYKNYSQNLDKIYLELATTPSLWDIKQADFLRTLCKSIADALAIEIVSVYVIENDNNTITQRNQYISSKQKHYSGLEFQMKDFPILLKPIREFRITGTHDSKNSIHLKELHDNYIIPMNIGASLYCAIHNRGKLLGGVCVEHVGEQRKWTEDEKRFLCSVSDLIAQRLHSSKALEEKEERYRAVFENSADAMFLTKNGICIDCNDTAEELFKCERKDLLQQSGLIVSPEFQPNGKSSEVFGKEKINAAMNGAKQSFEFTYKRFDNTFFIGEVKLRRVEISGEPFLLNSIRDISEHKIAQEKITLSKEKVLEQNKCLSLMNELSNKLQDIKTVDDIYRHTIETLIKMPLSPKAAIYSVNYEQKHLNYKTGAGFSPDVIKKFSVLPLNENFDAFFLSTGKAIYSEDLSTETRFDATLATQLYASGIKSLVEVPFLINGVRTAVLYLAYAETHSVSPEVLEILYSISKSVNLALENIKTRSELAYMAHHDSLTGLGNRALFHTEFNTLSYKNAALYLLDLDHFKEINDTLGHFTGDRVLQLIGPRLSNLINHHKHLVCRLGGDEFIVLVYDIKTDEIATQIAEAILDCLREPFKIDDLSLGIGSSIGVALYPKDASDSHELLRSADVAMYQAKKTGSGYFLYEKQLDIHTPDRLTMIADLGNSIDSGQLFLHYQPKIDLKSNAVVGFEALARWNHPRLGILAPNLFIPLIEMSPSIFQLTEEVLRQALAQQKQWLDRGYNFSVAVNISARNLIDERIIGLLENVLKEYNTPANMLELEITETAVIYDAYRASNYLKQISDLGILISIDDFGTGYSSLAYMNKLPIHKLKLDREFIMGMLDNQQGENIVKTIISLSKILELDIIAEGVEDQETLDKLKAMECNQAQGFHICRPNSWDKIEHWLENRN